MLPLTQLWRWRLYRNTFSCGPRSIDCSSEIEAALGETQHPRIGFDRQIGRNIQLNSNTAFGRRHGRKLRDKITQLKVFRLDDQFPLPIGLGQHIRQERSNPRKRSMHQIRRTAIGSDLTLADQLKAGYRVSQGIPDFMSAKAYQDFDDPQHIEKALQEYASTPLLSKPGEVLRYSNSGYVLLGRIIEKVSGKSYEEYLYENIFRPAGMDHTTIDHAPDVVPHRASGYRWDGETIVNAQYGNHSPR